MSDDETGRLVSAERSVARIREDDRQRRVAFLGAVVVGVAVVAIHWVGLFVAGALVGLTRRSVPRALVAGFGFGVAVLLIFFVLTPAVRPGNLARLAPLSYVSVGLALVGPTWGALARGVI